MYTISQIVPLYIFLYSLVYRFVFQQEQNRLSREREQRIQAEAERDRYKNEITAINEQLRNIKVLKKYTYIFFCLMLVISTFYSCSRASLLRKKFLFSFLDFLDCDYINTR